MRISGRFMDINASFLDGILLAATLLLDLVIFLICQSRGLKRMTLSWLMWTSLLVTVVSIEHCLPSVRSTGNLTALGLTIALCVALVCLLRIVEQIRMLVRNKNC
jgi:hypothetical protein